MTTAHNDPSDTPHIAVALDQAGWHPTAWREANARPSELFTAQYWTNLVTEAESGLLDFVTIEDTFGLRPAWQGPLTPRTDRVSGHLDAVLLAARIAPKTHHIGLLPTAVVTHTEPFHIAKAIATLDYVSHGRAGVRLQVSGSAPEAALFGRREIPKYSIKDIDDPNVAALVDKLFAEAADYAEVLRRLWDSWEDDAEIRDVVSGRFIDRDKLHYINFSGEFFSVRGPLITPRPPQGQPLIAALGHIATPFRLIGSSADIGFITPTDIADARSILSEITAAHTAAGRGGDDPVRVFVDLVVFLGDSVAAAQERKSRLDGWLDDEFHSDAQIYVGDAAGLADHITELTAVEGVSGVRLRPGALPDDLVSITRGLVPELQRRNLFRTSYTDSSLRERLGLPRPVNRYATTGQASIA